MTICKFVRNAGSQNLIFLFLFQNGGSRGKEARGVNAGRGARRDRSLDQWFGEMKSVGFAVLLCFSLAVHVLDG
jgi:hypothetical protein